MKIAGFVPIPISVVRDGGGMGRRKRTMECLALSDTKLKEGKGGRLVLYYSISFFNFSSWTIFWKLVMKA